MSEDVDGRDAEQLRDRASRHWTANPAGSNYSRAIPHSSQYYGDIEAHRYSTHPWLLAAIERFDLKDRSVLEIGYGMGTDHLNLARRGACMTGIDLSERSKEITETRLRENGLVPNLTVGAAERLPYANDTFDFVYSFGVVHHSPHTAAIVQEVHRVLKPGGSCWIAAYHRWSVFFLWTVFFVDWLVRRGFRKESLAQRVSRIEYPNVDPDLVVRLFSQREFRALFRDFSACRSSVNHLVQGDIALVGHHIPHRWVQRLSRRFGWYVIVEAIK